MIKLTALWHVSQVLIPDGPKDSLQVEQDGAHLERQARLLDVLIDRLVVHESAVGVPRKVQLLLLQQAHIIVIDCVTKHAEETLGKSYDLAVRRLKPFESTILLHVALQLIVNCVMERKRLSR